MGTIARSSIALCFALVFVYLTSPTAAQETPTFFEETTKFFAVPKDPQFTGTAQTLQIEWAVKNSSSPPSLASSGSSASDFNLATKVGNSIVWSQPIRSLYPGIWTLNQKTRLTANAALCIVKICWIDSDGNQYRGVIGFGANPSYCPGSTNTDPDCSE